MHHMYLFDPVRVDLGIKFFGMFGVLAAIATALIGVVRYFYEKNRDLYIRRLNEVYAPLYRLLIRQETMRKIRMPEIGIDVAPIITTINTRVVQNYQFGDNSSFSQEVTENIGILNRNEFVEVFNKSTIGLARPNLVNLMSQYEILIHLEESKEHDDKWEKASNEKVRIEILLIKEIVSGYRQTQRRLQLDDEKAIQEEEDFFKSIIT